MIYEEALIESLKKSLTFLELIVYRPSLYLSDYFYALRNQVDVETEWRISLYLNNRIINQNENDEEEDEDEDEDEDDPIINLINLKRKLIIDELDRLEKETLAHLNEQLADESPFRKRLEHLKIEIRVRNEFVDEQATKKMWLTAANSNNNNNKAEEIYQLDYKLEEMLKEVDEWVIEVERRLVNNRTILTRRSILPDSPVILVVFEDIFFLDHELEFLKCVNNNLSIEEILNVI